MAAHIGTYHVERLEQSTQQWRRVYVWEPHTLGSARAYAKLLSRRDRAPTRVLNRLTGRVVNTYARGEEGR